MQTSICRWKAQDRQGGISLKQMNGYLEPLQAMTKTFTLRALTAPTLRTSEKRQKQLELLVRLKAARRTIRTSGKNEAWPRRPTVTMKRKSIAASGGKIRAFPLFNRDSRTSTRRRLDGCWLGNRRFLLLLRRTRPSYRPRLLGLMGQERNSRNPGPTLHHWMCRRNKRNR